MVTTSRAELDKNAPAGELVELVAYVTWVFEANVESFE
jgi:hypothetical protein